MHTLVVNLDNLNWTNGKSKIAIKTRLYIAHAFSSRFGQESNHRPNTPLVAPKNY